MTLQVGQVLYYVPDDNRWGNGDREYTVTKIGRKWAELGGRHHRVNIETMWIDGGGYSSPGRCWPSREAWETEDRRQKLWCELSCAIYRTYHKAPPGITAERIEQAAALLGLSVDSTQKRG